MLTQDKEGSDCGNDRHVDQGRSEDEAPELFAERRSGEGRVGEQSRREEEVEQDDEERRSADEEEGGQHGGQEEERLGPSPRPGARPRSGRTHHHRRLLLLHASQIYTASNPTGAHDDVDDRGEETPYKAAPVQGGRQ